MQNIVLVIHLILALCLIVTVLMQRSEGGGLGIGGGGGTASGRPPASPMTKFTWILAVAFLVTSMSLVILSATNSSRDSVLESGGVTLPESDEPSVPSTGGLTGDLTPPKAEDAPAAPPKADE